MEKIPPPADVCMNIINNFQIPDLWQIVITTLLALVLIYLIEWLKQPSVKIEIDNDQVLNEGRKLLKVKVLVSKKGWYRRLFPWTNMASNARLKGNLISTKSGRRVILQSYLVKWDSAPEPWDYKDNTPRIELVPASASPENLLPGDEATACVAVKHNGEEFFYVFDGNYYVNRSANERSEKEAILQVYFSSSSATKMSEFVIVNSNKNINSFSIKNFANHN